MVQEGNDVWTTLGNTVAKAIEARYASKIATTSTPSPVVVQSAPFNPFPGFFSAYPQADGKTLPPSASGFAMNAGPLLVLVVIIIAAFALFRR